MKLTGESIVAGRGLAGSGVAFLAQNPATGEALQPPYRSVGDAEVERAAEAAALAFTSYRLSSGKTKGTFLRAIATRIDGLVDTLVARATQETGLPEVRIRAETARTTHQLRLLAATIEEGSWLDARIDHGDADRLPVPKPDLRSLLRPIGPVAVFGAANFPLAYSVAGGDTASALAAGCPVIVKAHPAHPGTSELVGLAVAEAARECGLPDGVFALLFDHGFEVGRALVAHPLMAAVGFTGSRAGGRALADVAAARPEPIPVFAEMGSVNPVFLLPGAIAARSAEIAAGLHASVTQSVGQFCTNPGLVIVQHGANSEHLIAQLNSRLSATPPGIMLSSGIAAAYEAGLARLQSRPGVERLSTPGAGGVLNRVSSKRFLEDRSLSVEVFGPSTLVVECAGREDMLSVARSLEGQLTSSIHAVETELAEYADLISMLETKVGRLVFNGYPTGVEVCAALVHGGPSPATSDGRSTSVGTRAILRFTRPVCFQNFPEALLPDELRESNPLGIVRMIDGRLKS